MGEELAAACEGLSEEEKNEIIHHINKMNLIHDAEDCERRVRLLPSIFYCCLFRVHLAPPLFHCPPFPSVAFSFICWSFRVQSSHGTFEN